MLLFNAEQLSVAFLIWMRVLSFLAAIPLLRLNGVPGRVKAGLSLILAYLLYLAVPASALQIETDSILAYGILAGKEVLFGLALGYAVNLIFACVQMAGQMVDFQIGFSMATYYDPMSGAQISLFGNLYEWVGVTLFFAVNGHHALIYALAQSLEAIPPGQLNLGKMNPEAIVTIFVDMFRISFEIAMPILFVILLTDLVMGILSRSVPQINILMLSLPLKMLIGLLAIIVLLPAFGNMLTSLFGSLPSRIRDFMKDMPVAMMAFAAGEKTEEATPKRKEDARKKGQVVKSYDLTSAVTLMLLVLVFQLMGNSVLTALHSYLTHSLENGMSRIVTQGNLTALFLQDSGIYLKAVLPMMGAVMGIGALANIVQTGLLWTTDPLKPHGQRLNPIEGLKNIFSKKVLLQFVKNLLKLILVGALSWSFVKENLEEILSLSRMSIYGVFPVLKDIVLGLFSRVGICLLALAAVDYVYQRFEFQKDLRMTREEVKEEWKQMEGDPQVRSLRRQKQRQMATTRMMSALPDSTVVVTNPTHLAVALRYEDSMKGAPVVTAKGMDFMADRIRKVAGEHEIPILENKPLARALFRHVEVGQEIPVELYQAVAEILATVYRMEEKTKMGTGMRENVGPNR